jgi:hypothetical protein
MEEAVGWGRQATNQLSSLNPLGLEYTLELSDHEHAFSHSEFINNNLMQSDLIRILKYQQQKCEL